MWHTGEHVHPFGVHEAEVMTQAGISSEAKRVGKTDRGIRWLASVEGSPQVD